MRISVSNDDNYHTASNLGLPFVHIDDINGNNIQNVLLVHSVYNYESYALLQRYSSLLNSRNITLLMPYIMYSRDTQHLKDFVYSLKEHHNINNMLSIDLHAQETYGIINISMSDFWKSFIRENTNIVDSVDKNIKNNAIEKNNINLEKPIQRPSLIGFSSIDQNWDKQSVPNFIEYIIVAPDKGASIRNPGLYDVILSKKRVDLGVMEIDVSKASALRGSAFIIVDDIIDTGSTIIAASKFLHNEFGTEKITVCATHGVFLIRDKSISDALQNSELIEKVYITDSVINTNTIQIIEKCNVVRVCDYILKCLRSKT